AAFSAASAAAGAEDQITRCFALRDSEPARAVTLAERALGGKELGVEARVKLTACLARSAANAGQARRALAAVAEVDALLARHPMPAEFELRALSNSGAALHTLGHIQPALDYYARAFEAARESESDLAQAAM